MDFKYEIELNKRKRFYKTLQYKRRIMMIREDIINFNRLRNSDRPYNFVKLHNGVWSHHDWLDFCRQITEAGYSPMHLDKLGELLESLKNELY